MINTRQKANMKHRNTVSNNKIHKMTEKEKQKINTSLPTSTTIVF